MKIAPVSADLLIKLALGAAVIGAIYYGVRKVSKAVEDFAPLDWTTDYLQRSTAGQVTRGILLNFTQPLSERVSGYEMNSPEVVEYGGPRYKNPLITDDGVNFGLF